VDGIDHPAGVMSSLLMLPGWVAGSVVTVGILIVSAPPLLHSARLRRRIAGLAIPRHRTAASPVMGRTRPGPRRLIRPVSLALLAAVAAAISPPLSGAALAAAWVWPRWRSAAARRRHDRAILAELPEVVDLLLVAVASGLNLRLSVAAVGERGPPLFGVALGRAATDIVAGARVADALDAALGGLGDPARPLAIALLGSARYGTSLTAALERLAIETRQLRRRQAEEAIRRVPVKLLFPLVLLVLPAFVLLTVVPLLASALRSLPF
jgi:tight adherence protein C